MQNELRFSSAPLEPRKNQARSGRCFRCRRSSKPMTRHHVIPQCYKWIMPEKFRKDIRCDVVAMCEPCHREYEELATKIKGLMSPNRDYGFTVNELGPLRLCRIWVWHFETFVGRGVAVLLPAGER